MEKSKNSERWPLLLTVILLGILMRPACANDEQKPEVEAKLLQAVERREPPMLAIEVTNNRSFPTGAIALKVSCASFYGFGLVSVVYVAAPPDVLRAQEKKKIWINAPESAKPNTCVIGVAGWFDPRVDGDALLQ
jgi:hypothetical protein